MLGSLTPLGERSRHSRWSRTIGAYVLASAAAGAVLGALLGTAGAVLSLHVHRVIALSALAVALIASIVLDIGGWNVPSPRRQVNENWMHVYRDWVYGGAYGFQLGLGVATIVTTGAVWVTLLAALFTGGVLAGLVIGITFGLVRALPSLLVWRATSPAVVIGVASRLRRLESPARIGALVLQFALVVFAIALAID